LDVKASVQRVLGRFGGIYLSIKFSFKPKGEQLQTVVATFCMIFQFFAEKGNQVKSLNENE
jgi:hypothetical protein